MTHLHHEDASTNELLVEQAQQRLREQEERGWGDEDDDAAAGAGGDGERKDPADAAQRPGTAQSAVRKGRVSSRQVMLAEEERDAGPSGSLSGRAKEAQVAGGDRPSSSASEPSAPSEG